MWRSLANAVCLLLALPVTGCAISSSASSSLTLDAASDKAVVILGTTIDKTASAIEGGSSDRMNVLLTQWQQYDPRSMQLIPGGSRAMSMRQDTVWSEATMRDLEIFVLEVEPGDYALIGVTIVHALNRTTTTFIPLTGSNFTSHPNVLFPMASEYEMQGPVDPRQNFLFSVAPGQVVYIGDFDFVHRGAGSFKVVEINYSHDQRAAHEALNAYPGISSEMVTLDLKAHTEQAAR